MVVEIGDEVPGRPDIDPAPAEIAAAIDRVAVILADAGAVHEAERREEVRARPA